MEGLDEPKKRPSRRGSRGGRGRGRATGTDGVLEPGEEAAASAEAEAVPARAPRRSRAKPPETAAETAADTTEDTETAVTEPQPAPRSRRGTPRQQAEIKAREDASAADVPAAAPVAAEHRGRSAASGSTDTALARAIDQQGRQIEQLIETIRRAGPGGPGPSSATRARVGIFVDAANVELASDRLRARFDWAKILDMLTRDRQLIRAIAYSPVHDDPGVSIETQRFVEPFLGKGFKVVTKPLKRFQDGTIKANVDIELALDIMEMLDRLDVVCLVSGDGDFQRLVEVVQSKGVRVEVVAVGNSTAGNLRNAADQFIDLQQRLREVRI